MGYDPNHYDDKLSDWDFDGVYLEESPKAVCVEIDGEEYWIPKSICRTKTANMNGLGIKMITVSIPEWWAKKEGLL